MTKKSTGKKGKADNQNSKPEKLARVITLLNYVLFFLLVVLVINEVLHFQNEDRVIETPALTLEVKEELKREIIPEIQDIQYLEEALYSEVMDEDIIPDFQSLLQQNQGKIPPPVSDVWNQKIAHINAIDIPAEDVYRFYEEKLPDNIIKRPKISDIKISLSHKPPHFGETPVIAIVIDDMGISHKRTADISSLKYPITASFLTYATELDLQIKNSVAAGQEIIAHLPMEPLVMQNVSPDVLTVKMSDQEIEAGLNEMLGKFSTIKGVNNHMGSRFTEDEKRMNVVMKIIEEKGLFFLDSKTTAKSAVEKSAKNYGVDYAARNVFLDNKDDYNYIMGQLKQTENIAQKEGYAIAIGHPKVQTYKALKAWLPSLKDKNLKLVHLSEIIKTLNRKN